MKLLYLRTHYWLGLKTGGSVSHTAGVINSLAKYCSLDVVSNDELPEVKIPYKIVPPVKFFMRLAKPFKIFDEILYNLKIIRMLSPEILHYDFIYQRYEEATFCGAYLAKNYNKPFILEYNGSPAWILKFWGRSNIYLKEIIKFPFNLLIRKPIYLKAERYNLKNAHLIVVVSEAMKKTLLEKRIPEDKIMVNPNGVDIEKFRPDIYSQEIVDKYKLKDKVVLGFIGTFGPWHGAENIVKAYGELIRKYPDYKKTTKLLMVGDGVKMPAVKENKKKYKIEDCVILTGLVPQSEAPKYLSVCDILINATVPNPDGTEFFGSPTKLFEYMAMGKAIISSDLGQMGDILEEGKTAILVRGGDVKGLKNAMKMLIDNKELRVLLGKNARKEVEEKYTWDKHVERILKRLEEYEFRILHK